jgi:acyl-coenzyme A thioesterase PaaI-like protein
MKTVRALCMEACLLDQAVSMIAWAANDQQPCTTIHLDTHFVAPSVAGDFIVARGEVVRKTSSLIFLRGTLSVNDKQVMYVQGIMKILHKKQTS